MNHMTCGYYRAKLDETLWALRVLDGRIVDAVGPLHASEMATPPMERRSAIKIDVAGWDLAAFRCVSAVWTLAKKTPMSGGVVSPRPTVEVFEPDGGFVSRLSGSQIGKHLHV